MIKRISAVLIPFILVIIVNCSLKEPVLPSWFLPVNIPLSEETFKLSEFVNDSTIIAQGQDSLITISLEGDLEPTGLMDLSLEPQSDSGAIGLESIKLDSLKDLSSGFTSLRELMPWLQPFVGNEVTIPETSLVSLSFTIESDDYESIHAISGLVTFKFFNNLPFPIGPNSSDANGISLTLSNDTLNQQMIIDIAIPDTIYPGETGIGSSQIPPGGIWIYSKLRVDYDLPVSEPTTVNVTNELLDNAGFQIEVDFKNFEADEAFARIQDQVFSNKVKFELENENRLREGVVDRGAVHIDFINEFNVDSKILFALPNIRTPQNTPFTDSIQIQANGSRGYDVALDNFSVINPDNPNAYIDSIDVDLTVFANSPSELVHITNMDSIAFIIQTDSIFLESFNGFFSLDTLKISEFSEDSIADYGDFGQGVFFQNAELSLNLMSELLIENLLLQLKITGYHSNEDGMITDSASLNIVQAVNSNGSPGNPDNIIISETGPEVANFLNILPTSISGSGTIFINGNAVIFQNSQIVGSYLFSTPLRLEVIGLAPIEGEVTTFIEKGAAAPNDTSLTDTLDNDIKDLGDDLQSGELQLDLINHTPLAVSVLMLVTSDLSRPDNSAFYDTLNFPINDAFGFVKSATIQAADKDSQTGFVTNPRTSTVLLKLTRDQLLMLTQPPFKVGYAVKVQDSNGVVALRSTDYVSVRGLAKLIVKIKDE